MTGGVVAILGPVGRNFAAGMSGGIAYVLDTGEALARQCARAGVEIERIAAPGSSSGDGAPRQKATGVHDNGMGHPLRYDAERLRILIERHQLATGSARAAELLADWPNALGRFVKIVPPEYRRALETLDAREAEKQPEREPVAAE
jgi:glutamate synthase (NADPH/NADH) large chain